MIKTFSETDGHLGEVVKTMVSSELGWDKQPPPPPLPAEVVSATSTRYVEAYERLSGRDLADWPGAA